MAAGIHLQTTEVVRGFECVSVAIGGSRVDRFERAELNAWLQDWADDDWDRQMVADAKNGGKLAKLKRDEECH